MTIVEWCGIITKKSCYNIINQDNIKVDLDELRKEIGNINGIGEKRLDEIMRVIDDFVNR